MTIPAGQMRHRWQLQRFETVKDEYGSSGDGSAWVNVGAPFWGRRTNTLKATTEAVASGTVVAPVQVRIDCRPRSVDAAMRLVGVGGDHDGVTYDIKNAGISNDRSEMAIIATSGASNG